MTKTPKKDLGNIPGTNFKILYYPTYRGIAQDLKFLRDIIKYHKTFPVDFRNRNRDFTATIQPPQMEYSWYAMVKKMTCDGASVGRYQKYSLMWALTILGLYAQTSSKGARLFYIDQKQIHPDFDLNLTLRNRPVPQYEVEFVLWLRNEVMTNIPLANRLTFGAKLWPGLPEEELIRMVFPQAREMVVDIRAKDSVPEEVEMGDVEISKVEEAESIDVELVNLFRKMDIEDLEKIEQEEEERLAV